MTDRKPSREEQISRFHQHRQARIAEVGQRAWSACVDENWEVNPWEARRVIAERAKQARVIRGQR